MSDLGADKQCFGKLCIGANLQDAEAPGPSAAFIQAKTDDGVKFNASVHEGSGLSRIHADKCLQITVGEDCSNEHEAFNVIATKGNIDLTAEHGSVRIKAKDITIDASDTLTISGNKINIGKVGADADKPDQVTITGNNVDTDADGGNMGDLLGTSPLMSIFAGTALAGVAAAAAGIAKAAGGAAGQMSGSEPIGISGAGGGAGGSGFSEQALSDLTDLAATISTGISSEYVMADGSTSRRYVGVGVGSTPGGSGGNTLGENGDIWYTLC